MEIGSRVLSGRLVLFGFAGDFSHFNHGFLVTNTSPRNKSVKLFLFLLFGQRNEYQRFSLHYLLRCKDLFFLLCRRHVNVYVESYYYEIWMYIECDVVWRAVFNVAMLNIFIHQARDIGHLLFDSQQSNYIICDLSGCHFASCCA